MDKSSIRKEAKLYFMGMPQSGGRKLDIAYLAVVDSIDEMKTLLQDSETYVDFGSSFSNVGVEYNKDGTHAKAIDHVDDNFDNLCDVCHSKMTSIKDALEAAEGTPVTIIGTITKIYYPYSYQFNDTSFYLTDTNGDTIVCYRVNGNWRLGDIVKVTGNVTEYNGVNQIDEGGNATKIGTCTHIYSDATCVAPKTCKICSSTDGKTLNHIFVDGVCSSCGYDRNGIEILPENLAFTDAVNRDSSDDYMAINYPDWAVSGSLGQTYTGYLGFGRTLFSNDNASITSPTILVTTEFTVSAVFTGNPNGTMSSTVTFTLVDTEGNTIAIGFADGVSEIVPVVGADATYNISFTFVSDKTWIDVSNLVISFVKYSGNIGFKSLEFIM